MSVEDWKELIGYVLFWGFIVVIAYKCLTD